jgi:hypothetical protein
MTDLPPFLLDLRSSSGAPITTIEDGDGAQVTLHEWTTWLRIRSDVVGFVSPSIPDDDDDFTGFVPPVFEDDGIAVLVHLRDHQDLDGRAIGLHHARLEVPELEALRAAVARIAWPNLPRPIGGDFNAPHFTLRYACGNLLIDRAFNARSGNFIEAIAPLWKLLDKLMIRAMRGASGTITPLVALKIDEDDPRRCSVRVALHNRSIGPVALTDPRVPTDAGPARLEVQIGERVVDRDWVGPYEWTTLELPALPKDAPRSLMLAARRRWQLELPWLAPKPGQYELRMRWSDYAGPLDPLPGQTPFMPVPTEGRAFVGSGPYPVRGSCQATLRFEIPGDEPRE